MGTATRSPITIVTATNAHHLVSRAARLLTDELTQRSGLRVVPGHRLPASLASLAVVVGVRGEIEAVVPGAPLVAPTRKEGRPCSEGYAIQGLGGSTPSTVIVSGNGPLGTLFGVGRLLRECRMARGRLELPTGLPIASAPHMATRGVQLGYRDVNNTLDAWSLEQFDRYLRDLILFGCNAVELTPPVTPPADGDRRDWDMNLGLGELVHSYGLQVCLWVPVTDGDARNPVDRRRVLDHRRGLFQDMAHIDHLFVPGGDPGDTPVDALLPLVADIADILRQAHPEAGVWVSHQGFEPPERDRFYHLLRDQRPEWLRGVVHGPWTRHAIAQTRLAVPAEYEVRAYPDITHSCRCQYPVPRWDQAFALIEGREVCNPRPEQHRLVFDHVASHCDGFVLYSDGVHDDANKALWLALGWDPRTDVYECLRQYGRAFVGPEAEDGVARGLLGLERNWLGSARHNRSIPRTLATWQRLCSAHAADWRVQLHHFRSLCDRYVHLKARHDQRREAQAQAVLRRALTGELSPALAARRARRVLDSPMPARLHAMRDELWTLGRRLRESIGLQLSVELGGMDERGNVLDYLDEPLNNRRWVCARLAEAGTGGDAEMLATITQILSWEDPGPGGFYDDLGNAERQPHLIAPVGWEEDPDCLRHPYEDFSLREHAEQGRLSWRSQATTLYEMPLLLRYTELDPSAQYRLRVVYTGRFGTTMTLTANGRLSIHGPLRQPDLPEVLEFELPPEATADGVLELEWRRVDRLGRGPQVAEAWLVRAG
jgi:hypothetical protein